MRLARSITALILLGIIACAIAGHGRGHGGGGHGHGGGRGQGQGQRPSTDEGGNVDANLGQGVEEGGEQPQEGEGSPPRGGGPGRGHGQGQRPPTVEGGDEDANLGQGANEGEEQGGEGSPPRGGSPGRGTGHGRGHGGGRGQGQGISAGRKPARDEDGAANQGQTDGDEDQALGREGSPSRGQGGGHGRGRGQGRGEAGERIRAERERLDRLPNRFVGKMDPHGHNKHSRNKTGKGRKFRNPKLIMWNGVAKLVRGITADDTPPLLEVPANIGNMTRHSRPCIQGKRYSELAPGAVSGGPSSEGFSVNDFKPCLERRRGSKQEVARDDVPQQDAPSIAQQYQESVTREEYARAATNRRRIKRSESYSVLTLLWKDPAKGVPYAFDRAFPTQYRQYVKNAINFWQNNSCLRFIEKASPTGINEPHILFTRGPNGCSTNRLGPNPSAPYSTVIDIGTCENLTGSIAHEIGHAMGLAHSQKRVDRDSSVKLYFENIAPSWGSQFDRNPARDFDDWGVPYYYDSIMHYFPYAASQNGLMTICPLDPLMELMMGQREEPAFGDISLMNRIYCQESCFPRAQLKGLKFFGNKSQTISGRTCQNWSTQTPTRHKYTTLGNHSSCRNPDNWEGGPWCFTLDPQVRFEPCFSPCEDLAALNRTKCQGWCYNGGYHHPKTCTCVCPRFASGPYCETVNKTALYSKAVECGGKTELKSGQKVTINSPNYPSNYPNSKACLWWFQAPNNTRVKATVQDFQLEVADPTGCYDYLEVRPSVCAAAIEPVDQMRFCGDSLSPATGRQSVLYSDDNNMVIKFFSDEAEPAKGFKLTVEIGNPATG